MNNQYFMETALELAARGAGYTSPNPMVGAVVVKNGEVVGRGWHQKAGGPHAEVFAINDAGELARDATLFVTLEPCNHVGRTDPCTKKILSAGIRHVVMAMADPNPDVAGGGAEFLIRNGATVETGVCENQARKLNDIFIKYIRTKRPFVLLKCAATLDGRIATRTGDAKWVTGPSARNYVHELRHRMDAIMVGINTVTADNPRLTARLEGKAAVDPIRVILDTHLSIPENANVLHLKSSADTLIVTGNLAPSGKRKRLEAAGIKIITADIKDGRIDLDALMNRLGEMGVTSLLIEGGALVSAAALKAGVVDKVCFFYAPKILGGDDGIPMCRGAGPELMSHSIPVTDITVRQFDGDVMIEGYIKQDKQSCLQAS